MNKERICGIYKITSPSGGIYIGQSTNCLKRFADYKSRIRNKQTRLNNSLKKYGWAAHKVEVIELCAPEQLDEREIFYIKHFDCFDTDHGLNLQSGGGRSRHSKESKAKISKSLTGKKRTAEQRKKIGDSQRGKIVPKEVGVKIAAKLRGRKVPAEQIQKMRDAHARRIDKRLSESTRKKISESLTGKHLDNDTKQKIRISHTGKKRSIESRLKQSKSRIGKKFTQEHKDNIRRSLTGKKHAEQRVLKNSASQKEAWRKKQLDGTNKWTVERRLNKRRIVNNKRGQYSLFEDTP